MIQMKKKFLLSMVLLSFFLMIGTNLKAQDDETSTYVAKIGDTNFETLKAAVTAANDSETGATIDIISDFYLTEKLTISKNITIQGEHTLTRGESYIGTFFVVNSGVTLTLDGGLVIDGNNNWTMDTTAYWNDVRNKVKVAKADSEKWLAREEGKPVATAYMITTTGGTINLNNVTIQNNYSSGSGVISASAGSIVNLTGAQLKHICSYQGQGVVVYASGADIFVNMNEGTLIDGLHVGGNHGVFMIYYGAKFTMNGGEVRNTTGWNSNGVVVGLYSTVSNKPSVCIINDGKMCSNSSVKGPNNTLANTVYIHSYTVFEMNGGVICHNYCGNYGVIIINNPNNISVTINGGSIVDNTSVSNSVYTDLYDNETNLPQINGGTFNQDISQWLSPGCGLIYDEETGTYTVPNNDADNVFVFKNEEDNNWHNAENWSKGSIPSEDDIVVIASPVVIENGNIAVADVVSISSDITIEDGGQLYHNNVNVNATVEKSIEGDPIQGLNYVGGWYSISSPIVGSQTFDKINGLINETHDLYRYNESLALWENVKYEENDFTTIDPGRGYLYANTEDTELQFSGKLCVKDVNYTLSAESANLTGFNLIGNPFAHNITSDHFSGAPLSEGFYVLSNAGEWGAKLSGSSSVIAPCQGALVQTQQHNAVLTISKNANVKRRSNDGSIAISVSNGKYSDMAYVSFSDGYGLNKINHQNPDAPMLYLPVDGEKFAVAVMEKKIEEIPVAFKAKKMGEYTISATTESCKFSEMYLVDRVTGKETNLNVDSYTFIASTSDSPERFCIRMSSDSSSDNFAFVNNGELIINNVEGNGYIRIFDVMGRPIAECNACESTRISVSTFADGVYIIQKVDDNGVNVQKVMVK